MGVFKVDEGMFYKSITSLAYGKYFYTLSQYDENDNLIVESSCIDFIIKPPNYSSKGIVKPCG